MSKTSKTSKTNNADRMHETLKRVNTFNMLKGVQGGYMSSTQQHRRDTDRHTQTHEIDARDEQRGQDARDEQRGQDAQDEQRGQDARDA